MNKLARNIAIGLGSLALIITSAGPALANSNHHDDNFSFSRVELRNRRDDNHRDFRRFNQFDRFDQFDSFNDFDRFDDRNNNRNNRRGGRSSIEIDRRFNLEIRSDVDIQNDTDIRIDTGGNSADRNNGDVSVRSGDGTVRIDIRN